MLTAYIRPEEIKILYPERGLDRAVRLNWVTGSVVDRQPTAGGHLIKVRLDATGEMVAVRFSTQAYARLNLHRGAPVQLSLRQAGIVIL